MVTKKCANKNYTFLVLDTYKTGLETMYEDDITSPTIISATGPDATSALESALMRNDIDAQWVENRLLVYVHNPCTGVFERMGTVEFAGIRIVP